VNVKHKLNEYTRHESLILSDVETPMMEMFMYSKHRFGMKAKICD